MDLFINSDVTKVCGYETFKTMTDKNSNLAFCFASLLENQKDFEEIKFIFHTDIDVHLKKSVILEKVFVERKGKNNYHIKPQKSKKATSLYAILKNSKIVPSDIYIPANMKDKVKVIRKITCPDFEVDYGDFLSNVYLLKISLRKGECLPIFFTSSNPIVLNKHMVIYKSIFDERYDFNENLETYIILNKNNISDYISLSTL